MSGQNVADAMEAEIPDEASEESITQDIEESVAVPDKKKEEKYKFPRILQVQYRQSYKLS